MLFSGTRSRFSRGVNVLRRKKIEKLANKSDPQRSKAMTPQNSSANASALWPSCELSFASIGLRTFEFCGNSRIAETVFVQIDEVEQDAVLHFAFSEIV